MEKEITIQNPVVCGRCSHMEFWVEAVKASDSLIIFSCLICMHCGNRVSIEAIPSMPPMDQAGWGHA